MPDQPDHPDQTADHKPADADATQIVARGEPAAAPSGESTSVAPTSVPPGAPTPVPSGAARPPADPGKIEPGDILGHTYEIEALLARGGMGEVYRARHTELGSLHAIKIILPHLTSDPRIVAMFKEEAKKLRKVRDDAVVAYEGLFRDEFGRRYLVMEFVDGISLAKLIKQRALDPDEVRRLRDRCALGLAAAHDKGIYHRDISPDNIILVDGKTEHAKIIDFGIAKSSDAGDRTVVGQDFAGKYSYVSPEQLGAFGGQVDGRSDIYSLGLVLVAAAQGRALDMGNSPISVIEKRQAVPDLGGVPPDLRGELEPLLRPNPNDRPQSMRELAGMTASTAAAALAPVAGAGSAASIVRADDLDDIMPVAAAAPSPPPVPPSQAVAPAPRRSPVMAIAAAVISFVVVVGGGAAYILLNRSEGPTEVATADAKPTPVAPPAVTQPPVAPPPVAQPAAVAPPPAVASAEAAPVTPSPAAIAALQPTSSPIAPPPASPPPASAPAPAVAVQPAPVPIAPPPTPVPAPVASTSLPTAEPAATPTQTASLEPLRQETSARIERLIAGIQCADLTASVSGDLKVELSGFVGQQADLDKLRGAVRGMDRVKLAGDSVAVYAFPHCAFVKLLRQTASAGNAQAAPRLDFNKASKVYKNGDKLTVKATEGKQRDGYLYVDYIDNGGTVVHIFPTPLRKNNFVKAGQQVSIGTTDANAKGDERVYEISEPFGPNLIIAISSPKPLFDGQLEEAEPADQYLRALQSRLAGLAATPSGKDLASAYSLIDTVE